MSQAENNWFHDLFVDEVKGTLSGRGGGGGSLTGAVLYTEQTLTDAQKAQVRKNINTTKGITPQMFGAKADGVTDDSAAIQAALDACNEAGGATVHFPAGTYLICSTINAYSNQQLTGEVGTVLKRSSGAVLMLSLDATSNVVLERLELDGGKGLTASASLMSTNNAEKVRIDSCKLKNGFAVSSGSAAGAWITDSDDVVFTDCEFDLENLKNSKTSCIRANGGGDVRVVDCRFKHCYFGVAGSGATNVVTMDSIFIDAFMPMNIKGNGIVSYAINNIAINSADNSLYGFYGVSYTAGFGNIANGKAYSKDLTTPGLVKSVDGYLPDENGNVTTPYEAPTQPTDAKFFDIDYDGIVSLKSEYINELPEKIVIPDVVNGTAVAGFEEGMFQGNLRVKEITIPDAVRTIPASFCNEAKMLTSIKNTTNITGLGDNAFRRTRIDKALFPNLKTAGCNVFECCVYMTTADIGDKLEEIPASMFRLCQWLSHVNGGASVKSIGEKAFYSTYSLKNLPLLRNVTSVGDYAFFTSRIQFDWDTLTDCEFGEYATPTADNDLKYWEDEGVTFTPCNNGLNTIVDQSNPIWVNDTYGTTGRTYYLGCALMAYLHIHSALSGKTYNNPKEFENDLGDLNPALLGLSVGNMENIDQFIDALRYEIRDTERFEGDTPITKDVLNTVYKALSEGAYVLYGMSRPGYEDKSTDQTVNGAHAVVAYGVNDIGELLVVDSGTAASTVDACDDTRFCLYQIPIQNVTGPTSNIYIVRKPT